MPGGTQIKLHILVEEDESVSEDCYNFVGCPVLFHAGVSKSKAQDREWRTDRQFEEEYGKKGLAEI